MSCPRKRASIEHVCLWFPAFAGKTFGTRYSALGTRYSALDTIPLAALFQLFAAGTGR